MHCGCILLAVNCRAFCECQCCLQPDELASGRETSSSQNDEDDEDNMSVVGSAKSITALYQRQFSERDGDLFYDAPEPSRRLPTRATESPLGTPERLSPVQSKASPTPANSLESPVPAVLASATKEQAVLPSSQAGSAAGGTLPSTAATWLAGEPSVQRRLALPDPKETQKSVSLWSIIKEALSLIHI